MKQFYFTVSTVLTDGKPYHLRLVVLRDDDDAAIDHYFEYGAPRDHDLCLDDSLWSADAEALLDYMPRAAQFHASMDLRQFLRSDLMDALDGSLMADDVEMLLDRDRTALAPA